MEASMKYISTRDEEAVGVSFVDSILQGLAADGGLFVPESIPKISEAEMENLKQAPYKELAFNIMRGFICRDEISDNELNELISDAYSSFRHQEVTPISKEMHTDVFILELFHGPTWAFKDVALQFLGPLFDLVLKKRKQKLVILGATSGDTGSAAIAGVRGRENIECVILFPEGRTSRLQELQMTSYLDKNILTVAVQGSNFDDCQTMVKQCFTSELRDELSLGAVNSINWARILAQIVYYWYAALRVRECKRSRTGLVSFAVPTGNFGDILAAYYAKKMGCPIGRLIIGSNQNDILPRFFDSGVYQVTDVRPSLSPSMDIAISSNFERFLFDLFDRDAKKLKDKMASLKTSKQFSVSPSELSQAQAEFKAVRVDEEETVRMLKSLYSSHQYLLCPHSAVGYSAAVTLQSPGEIVVALATAHMGKFAESTSDKLREDGKEQSTLGKALEECTPPELARLNDLPTRKIPLENDLEALKAFLRANCGKSECRSWGALKEWRLGGLVVGGALALTFALMVARKGKAW